LSDIVSRNTGVGPLRDNVLLVPTYPLKFSPFHAASGPGHDFWLRAEAH
jgi:hypothetical protein